MRPIVLPLALLASAFTLPLAAHADTIDDFTLGQSGHTITYSLPNSAIVMNHPHAVWLNASAPATIDGVPGYNVGGEYYLPGFASPTVDRTQRPILHQRRRPDPLRGMGPASLRNYPDR